MRLWFLSVGQIPDEHAPTIIKVGVLRDCRTRLCTDRFRPPRLQVHTKAVVPRCFRNERNLRTIF